MALPPVSGWSPGGEHATPSRPGHAAGARHSASSFAEALAQHGAPGPAGDTSAPVTGFAAQGAPTAASFPAPPYGEGARPAAQRPPRAAPENASRGAAPAPAPPAAHPGDALLLAFAPGARAPAAPAPVPALRLVTEPPAAPGAAPALRAPAAPAPRISLAPAPAAAPAKAPLGRATFVATASARDARAAASAITAGARRASDPRAASLQRVPGLRANDPAARKASARPHSAHDRAQHDPAQPPAAPQVQSQQVQAQAAARAELATSAQSPEPAGSGLASLPPALREATLEDSSLRLTVLPHAANLRVSVPDGGDLSVHVRVRDGVANLTVAGNGSESAIAHSSDLRAALAGQGLSLGRIDRASAGPAASPADAAGSRARSRATSQGRGHGDSSSTVEESGEAPATESALAHGLQ